MFLIVWVKPNLHSAPHAHLSGLCNILHVGAEKRIVEMVSSIHAVTCSTIDLRMMQEEHSFSKINFKHIIDG